MRGGYSEKKVVCVIRSCWIERNSRVFWHHWLFWWRGSRRKWGGVNMCLGHRCCWCRIIWYKKIILMIQTCWRFGWLCGWRRSIFYASCRGWRLCHYLVIEWRIGINCTRKIMGRINV